MSVYIIMPIIMEIKDLDGGVMPTTNNNLWLMENEAYDAKPDRNVNGWELLEPYSEGIKAYKNGKDIVVAIRGTADLRDIQADLQIVYSGLKNSSRFKHDVNILRAIQGKYPRMFETNIYIFTHTYIY